MAADPGWDYDVAVVGGGPAGAATALGLLQRGRRVLVLEREEFPRFHVGESLLPMSNRVFHELRLDELLAGEPLVEKWGANFITADGQYDRYADFTQAYEVLEARAYQVVRARFDEVLLAEAGRRGADVRQPVKALGADFAADHVVLEFEDAAGAATTVRAGAVADASGRHGFLARRLGLRQVDPELKKISIYAHFENVPRLEGRRAGDIRLVSRMDMGWFWFIPISATLTSAGVVVDAQAHRARVAESGDSDLARLFDAYVEETPAAADLLRESRRTIPYRVESDFSYTTTAYHGDRFALVGDAGSFLDPIFSTGVHMALVGGLEASRALDAALGEGGSFQSKPLVRYEKLQRRRYDYFRRFVTGYYTPEFRDLFFQPGAVPPMFRSVTSVLAGNDRPSLRTRFLNALFFQLVRIQRHYPLLPRLHPQPE